MSSKALTRRFSNFYPKKLIDLITTKLKMNWFDSEVKFHIKVSKLYIIFFTKSADIYYKAFTWI